MTKTSGSSTTIAPSTTDMSFWGGLTSTDTHNLLQEKSTVYTPKKNTKFVDMDDPFVTFHSMNGFGCKTF